MPIEEALEDLGGGKVPEKDETKVLVGGEVDAALWRDARAVMSPVLVQYFHGKLKEQSDVSIPPVVGEVVGLVGFEALVIEPSTKRMLPRTERVLEERLVSLNDREAFVRVLEVIAQSVESKDVVEALAKLSPKRAVASVPELRILESYLESVPVWEKTARVTLHPYMLVMGMPVGYRPLAVLAVRRAIEAARINEPKLGVQNMLKNTHRGSASQKKVRAMLVEMTPLTEDYVAAAKKYNVMKDVVSVMEEFGASCEKYVKRWW